MFKTEILFHRSESLPMVMCLGSTDYYNNRGSPRLRGRSIVYFPSQDAITASVIPHGVNMWTSGTKRKLEEEEAEQSYFNQRESILNISMIKLRSKPIRKVEQPLRRSVLIFNTLKHIETELKVEGVRWNPLAKTSLLPTLEANSDLTLDPLPADSESESRTAWSDRAGHVPNNLKNSPSKGCSMAMDTSHCPVGPTVTTTTSDCMDNSTCSGTTLPTDNSISCSSSVPSMVHHSTSIFSDTRSMDLFNLPITSQQGPLPTFSSLLDLDSHTTSSNQTTSSSSGYTASSSSSLLQSSPCLPTLSSSSSSLSGHSSSQHSISKLSTSSTAASVSTTNSSPIPALSQQYQSTLLSLSATTSNSSLEQHDLFSDFDFSSMDLDFFSFLPSNLKLPSLSPEDLQSLPHPEAFPGSSLSSSCNPKYSDLVDDLDSIMQILVGI